MPPSAEDVPYLSDIDLDEPPQLTKKAAWPAPAAKKGKRGKKGRRDGEALSRPAETGGEEQGTVVREDVEDGVRLSEGSPPDALLRSPEPEVCEEQLLVDLNGHAGENETGKMQDVQPPTMFAPQMQQPSRTEPMVSPRPAAARPVSYSRTPPSRPTSLSSPPQQYAYPLPATLRSHNTAVQARRPSRSSPSQRIVEPLAPPHMPQPHFYGMPDLGLFSGRKEQSGKTAGSGGYCCCFDSFAEGGEDVSAKKARDALLVGSEGGLDAYRVLPNKLEIVARLEGLRGSVVGAKILPHVEQHSFGQDQRPLVMVIVHGVMEDESSALQGSEDDRPVLYQTTVEVYSLKTSAHIATLFRSAAVPMEQPSANHLPIAPGPVGDLTSTANGKYITITSGKSGEVFVFTNTLTPSEDEPHFRCIGKFWTSLQATPTRSLSRPQTASEGSQPVDEIDRKAGVPLFSLSRRWLAIVPPSTSSHVSIHASVLLPEHNPQPPGLLSHGAPQQPPVTCDLAGVDAEGTFGRLTRQAAQGFVKYSQRGLEMGWQGWNELVHPSNQPAGQHVRSSSKDDQFPPTNAPPDDGRSNISEPALVSIIDLEALTTVEAMKSKTTPAPLATFALQEGCNYVSFASSGLRLLTVSRSGEISTVWDLRQIAHSIHGDWQARTETDTVSMPCAKQITRMIRSSQAIVVDSAWSRDDDFLAVRTAHGTVHLYDVPADPPLRKRKRRLAPDQNAGAAKAQAAVGVTHSTSPPSSSTTPGGGFFGTLRSVSQTVGNQVSTFRSQQSFGRPTVAGLREATSQVSHAGSRAVVRGIGHGLSAARTGAVDYWNADDNKIRHKALQQGGSSNCMRWLQRPSGMTLAIACGGSVHLHPVSRIQRQRGDVAATGLRHDRAGVKKYDLLGIRTSDDTTLPFKKLQGFWSLYPSPDAPKVQRNGSSPPSQQTNEVESNPPYCPFHVDARVNIYAFDTEDAVGGSSPFSSGQGDSVWVFGGPLPASTKLNSHDELRVPDQGDDDDGFGDEGVTDGDLEAIAEQVESRLTVKSVGEGKEEIRVMTRPLRGRGRVEDEDGWEDDGGEMM